MNSVRIKPRTPLFALIDQGNRSIAKQLEHVKAAILKQTDHEPGGLDRWVAYLFLAVNPDGSFDCEQDVGKLLRHASDVDDIWSMHEVDADDFATEAARLADGIVRLSEISERDFQTFHAICIELGKMKDEADSATGAVPGLTARSGGDSPEGGRDGGSGEAAAPNRQDAAGAGGADSKVTQSRAANESAVAPAVSKKIDENGDSAARATSEAPKGGRRSKSKSRKQVGASSRAARSPAKADAAAQAADDAAGSAPDTGKGPASDATETSELEATEVPAAKDRSTKASDEKSG